MATPLNLSWQGSVGCLRLYRSDMSWQIVGVSGRGLCTESGNMGNYIRKKKKRKQKHNKKSVGTPACSHNMSSFPKGHP